MSMKSSLKKKIKEKKLNILPLTFVYKADIIIIVTLAK